MNMIHSPERAPRGAQKMSQILRDFREHPDAVGETYHQHWCSAMGFVVTLAGGALACTVHAFVPGLKRRGVPLGHWQAASRRARS